MTPTAWIERSVIRFMSYEACSAKELETGGILMGYWAASNTDVVVTHVTGPGPLAIHREDGFVPDHRFHEQEAARIYETSNRCHTYLGDWHTHPQSNTMLSKRDKGTLKKISKNIEARAHCPIMVVIGGYPEMRLAVWAYFPRGTLRKWWGEIISLNIEIYD